MCVHFYHPSKEWLFDLWKRFWLLYGNTTTVLEQGVVEAMGSLNPLAEWRFSDIEFVDGFELSRLGLDVPFDDF